MLQHQSPGPTVLPYQSPTPTPQPTSAFFTTLSAELRLAILTVAFGERTIHVSFFDRKPAHPYDGPIGWPKKIPDGSYKICSTVCRRNAGQAGNAIIWHHSVAHDSCVAVYPSDDDKKTWSEEGLAELHLGISGWVLSCQQAYVEGLDVLYSTNTFHFDRPLLAANLSSFFPQDSLARIRKVELKLDWRYARFEGDREPFDRRLQTILTNLPTQMPRLTHLTIAFQDNLWPDPDARRGPTEEESRPWIEDKAILPLARFVHMMERLETFEVYFASSVHRMLRKDEQWKRGRNGDFRASFWRGVDGSEQGKKGYWICEGEDDSPVMCTMMPPAREVIADRNNGSVAPGTHPSVSWKRL